MNPFQSSLAAGQHETLLQNEINYDHSNSPSSTLKRRAIANSLLMNLRSSNERLSTFPSSSIASLTNGSNDFHSTNQGIEREMTVDSFDQIPASRQGRPLFEAITDFPVDRKEPAFEPSMANNDTSLLTNALTDDRRSLSSEKARKELSARRLFKPFQNMRFRKKSSTS